MINKSSGGFNLLILFFIMALSLLFVHTQKAAQELVHLNEYKSYLAQMSLLNHKFNFITMDSLKVVNYDDINSDMNRFEELMTILTSTAFNEHSTPEINNSFQELQRKYMKKANLIEQFKTLNAEVANSINAIYDVRKKIRLYSYRDRKKQKLFEHIFFTIGQILMKIPYDKKVLLSDIANLKAYQDKHKLLKYAYRHISHLVYGVNKLEDIVIKLNHLQLIEIFKKLDSAVSENYDIQKSSMDSISILFFTLTVMLLLLLGVIYNRLQRNAKELLAFRHAIGDSDNAIIITDINRKIEYVNSTFEKNTGYRRDEVIGKDPSMLKSSLVDRAVYDDLNKTINSGKKWQGELINRRKDGSLLYEKVSITPLVMDDKLVKYLAVKLDITDYIKQNEKIEYIAYHDNLTGLPNRAYFDSKIDSLLVKNNNSFAIFFIDLDRFKTINDTLGHHIGDGMLQSIATSLSSCLEDSNILARIGGDEFVVIMHNPQSDKDITILANNILNAIRKPILVDDYHLNTTASIGISVYPKDGREKDSIIKHADSAMYYAKDMGKDNYQFYTKQLSIDVEKRLTMEQELLYAIDRNEIVLNFQPQYYLKDRSISGAEALARWHSKKLGFVPPDQFIQVAEETGFIVQLGYYIFEEACKEYMRWLDNGIDIAIISINFSSIQFREENIFDRIKSIIYRTKIDPSRIEIEITERFITEYSAANMTILENLRDLGCKISIDDFGTGYSSLSYMKTLPIDTIKIDKSFIDDLPHSEHDVKVSKAIIALSHSLEYSVVAEGIEDAEQERFLLDNGCDIGQGYHYAKPMSGDDFIEFAKDRLYSI